MKIQVEAVRLYEGAEFLAQQMARRGGRAVVVLPSKAAFQVWAPVFEEAFLHNDEYDEIPEIVKSRRLLECGGVKVMFVSPDSVLDGYHFEWAVFERGLSLPPGLHLAMPTQRVIMVDGL